MSDSLWNDIKQQDRWKPIYAYLVSYILIISIIDLDISNELYKRFSYTIAKKISSNLSFVLSMLVYLPIVFPPTIIRFVYFKRGLEYGRELCYYISLSIAISLFLSYSLTGITTSSLGFMGALAVYAILSYGTTKPNTTPQSLRITLTAIAIVMLFLSSFTLPRVIPKSEFLVAPVWDIVVVCYALNSHKPKSYYQSQKEQQQSSQSDTHEGYSHIPQYEVFKLINLGLACIGRKTKRTNLYFTPEREAQRRAAERPFLLQLANMYKDASARKALAKHFMLYKEVCLFVIFATVLKNNQELHSILKPELTKQLNEGLTPDALKHRKEYMFMFSKAFYDEYQRTHNMERTLSFTFWSVLRDKHPQLVSELPELTGLGTIYKYVYGEVKRECD